MCGRKVAVALQVVVSSTNLARLGVGATRGCASSELDFLSLFCSSDAANASLWRFDCRGRVSKIVSGSQVTRRVLRAAPMRRKADFFGRASLVQDEEVEVDEDDVEVKEEHESSEVGGNGETGGLIKYASSVSTEEEEQSDAGEPGTGEPGPKIASYEPLPPTTHISHP